MLTSAKLRRYKKADFLKLKTCVYLRTKFYISIIVLRSFRQGDVGGGIPPPPPTHTHTQSNTHTTAKRTLKRPTQIRFIMFQSKVRARIEWFIFIDSTMATCVNEIRY